MAVPGQATGVIVESRTPASTNLQWVLADQTDTGVKIKRSTDGVTYSIIATTAAHATTYEDDTVTAATLYYYKVTPTNGSGDATDSAVVMVVAQSKTCEVGNANPDAVALPRAGSQVDSTVFNDAMNALETSQNQNSFSAQPCTICITNNAIVADCTKCSQFQVSVTSDINSISLLNCDNNPGGDLNFQIPAGGTPRIGGFPSNLGFDGFEGNKPISGGTSGRDYHLKFTSGKSARGQKGGTLPLSLTCAATNCSMACAGAKSLSVTAAGGTPPYTFLVTGGLGLTPSGSTATVTPAANPGSGTAGTAYQLRANSQLANSGLCVTQLCSQNFGCNDVAIGGITAGNGCLECGGVYPKPQCGDCTSVATCSNCATNICSPHVNLGSPCTCNMLIAPNCVSDSRTGAMITAGCNPCAISINGQVITVTDAKGANVSKTITT